MDYDAWRLAGPEECTEPDVVTCDQCDGSGMQIRFDGDPGLCSICHGDGVMPARLKNPMVTTCMNAAAIRQWRTEE